MVRTILPTSDDEPYNLRVPGEIPDLKFLSSRPLIYHPIFELITPTGGPRARMSGFTNDLTYFLGFPSLGAIIPNFLGWEHIDIQNLNHIT